MKLYPETTSQSLDDEQNTEPIEILSKSLFEGKLKYTLMTPTGHVLPIVAASDEEAFSIYREREKEGIS